MLILDSFEKAIQSLSIVLKEREIHPDNLFVRDAAIQRFEYTYEISHKMLKRHLEATSPTPTEIDGMSFQNIIRTGSERGLLLNGWEKWRLYRTSRGTTSHAYDEKKALQVLEIIPDFYEEAKHLLASLKENNT